MNEPPRVHCPRCKRHIGMSGAGDHAVCAACVKEVFSILRKPGARIVGYQAGDDGTSEPRGDFATVMVRVEYPA